MSTATATAYNYSAAWHPSLRVPKCEKAQKSSGFWANGTYRHCIKDNVLLDPPYNTGNDFVYADDFLMNGEEWDVVSATIDNESGNRLVRNTDSNGRFHSDWCSMLYSEGNIISINSQWSQKRVEEGLIDGTVRFSKTSSGWSLHHKVYMKEGQVLRSLLTDYGNNRSAGQDISSLFESIVFDYSKPAYLLRGRD